MRRVLSTTQLLGAGAIVRYSAEWHRERGFRAHTYYFVASSQIGAFIDSIRHSTF